MLEFKKKPARWSIVMCHFKKNHYFDIIQVHSTIYVNYILTLPLAFLDSELG